MNKELKINDVEVKLDKDGQLYYLGKEFEIIKWGKEDWQYKVYMEGKEVAGVVSVDFSLRVGEAPVIRLSVRD